MLGRFSVLAVAVAAAFVTSVSPQISLAANDSDILCFNVQNHKFHALSCIWAKRCTVHCIEVTRKEAHSRGGIPCKVCGGGEV